MSERKTVAIIPARGGSKRIRGKNNKSFVGQMSLVECAIQVAQESELFDEIIVNSDDRLTLEIAERAGVLAYLRPSKLASDTAFVIEVIQNTLDALDIDNTSEVAILLPTSPLRLSSDILEAYDLFKRNDCFAPVVSVSTYETPIFLAQRLTDEGTLEPVFPEHYNKSTRSTDHEEVYRYNEAIIFSTAYLLRNQNNLIGVKWNPVPYVMPPERSIAIDYQYQFNLAQNVYKGRFDAEN